MSFTLRVSFHGMCLFIQPQDTEEMHVLMPATGGTADGDSCACEPHVPRLIFDAAHLLPNQTAPNYAQVHYSLKNRVLDLPQAGNAFDGALPSGLANLGSVRADVVSGENVDLVASHVVMRNGSVTDYAKGDCWEWQGQIQRLSHIVEWSVADLTGDSLDLALQGLAGGYSGAVPTLYPINGVVELEVWHAPHTELPPDYIVPPPPTTRGAAQHFASYGKLLVAGTTDVPAYAPNECAPIQNPGKYDDGPRSSVTYSCVGGQGTLP
jgi:hypothetical protein